MGDIAAVHMYMVCKLIECNGVCIPFFHILHDQKYSFTVFLLFADQYPEDFFRLHQNLCFKLANIGAVCHFNDLIDRKHSSVPILQMTPVQIQ